MTFSVPRTHPGHDLVVADSSVGRKYITGRVARAPIEKRAGFSARSRIFAAAEDFGESGLDALWNVA
ncbi:MAG: hypothetical protein H7X97_12325 [Opitutaceae bacterium]|nr:hypothetical protein [Verrucomicrobiales bacterium]